MLSPRGPTSIKYLSDKEDDNRNPKATAVLRGTNTLPERVKRRRMPLSESFPNLGPSL